MTRHSTTIVLDQGMTPDTISDAQAAAAEALRNLSFRDHRSAALALLNGDGPLTRKAGSFLGQCAVDPSPLSPKQSDWLATLLDRAGLPAIEGGD